VSRTLNMKIYIGDSIYAELNDSELIITTENGYGPTNRIVFGGAEWQSLVDFVDKITRFREAPNESSVKH